MNTNAQTNEPSAPFPSNYYNIITDTARMRFLMNTISDSLNSGKLNLVYNMAKRRRCTCGKEQLGYYERHFLF